MRKRWYHVHVGWTVSAAPGGATRTVRGSSSGVGPVPLIAPPFLNDDLAGSAVPCALVRGVNVRHLRGDLAACRRRRPDGRMKALPKYVSPRGPWTGWTGRTPPPERRRRRSGRRAQAGGAGDPVARQRGSDPDASATTSSTKSHLLIFPFIAPGKRLFFSDGPSRPGCGSSTPTIDEHRRRGFGT